jgi:hypothetical protein
MIFSGVLLNFDSIPKYFVWLRYMSWFSYSYELLMVNQWQGVTGIGCPFNATGASVGNGPVGRCFRTGEDIISGLKIDPVDKKI